jgi:hypothetical protein
MNDVLGRVELPYLPKAFKFTVGRSASGNLKLKTETSGAGKLAALISSSPLLVDQLIAATDGGVKVTFKVDVVNRRLKRSSLTVAY